MVYLVSNISNPKISYTAKYILDRYLSNNIGSEDAVEGLIYKKLARKSMGIIVIEPVIDFLVRTTLSANKFWEIDSNNTKMSVFVVKANDLYLYVQSYPVIDGTWKVTPFNNLNEIKEELINIFDYEISMVDNNGKRSIIQPTHDLSWLEEV